MEERFNQFILNDFAHLVAKVSNLEGMMKVIVALGVALVSVALTALAALIALVVKG